MNLKEQMQELKEFFINIRTEDELSNETGLNIAHAIESDGWFHGVMALGIPYMGMLIPIIIVFIVFYFQAKENRDKYNALIEVSKNVEDPDVVEDLLNNFKEEMKWALEGNGPFSMPRKTQFFENGQKLYNISWSQGATVDLAYRIGSWFTAYLVHQNGEQSIYDFWEFQYFLHF